MSPNWMRHVNLYNWIFLVWNAALSRISTAGTFSGDEELLDELGVFPPQEPGSEWSSGDVFPLKKSLHRGGFQKYRNFGDGVSRAKHFWLVEYWQHLISATI